ncbi:MAG: hypothetical protein LC134_01270 [Chitinophagales bacterium]|nr:hypothetical protein [Chitinophagaceae bacterium]MCZ2224196.1 hypothetical protein [Chitinophagales bacterium]MCZ2298089.1 hypothetical protein [Chitinophagales bacterium]
MSTKLRYIIAIILILLVCWFGYTFTEEINKISNAPKPFKQQLQRLLWLILVGIITWWAFVKNTKKWLAQTVIIVYGFAVIIIGLLGLVEWKYKILGENIKELIAGVRLFLSSPLPFIFLWILSSVKFETEQKN